MTFGERERNDSFTPAKLGHLERETGKEMEMKDLKALPTGTQEIKIFYITYRVSGKYNITYEMKIVFER